MTKMEGFFQLATQSFKSLFEIPGLGGRQGRLFPKSLSYEHGAAACVGWAALMTVTGISGKEFSSGWEKATDQETLKPKEQTSAVSNLAANNSTSALFSFFPPGSSKHILARCFHIGLF